MELIFHRLNSILNKQGGTIMSNVKVYFDNENNVVIEKDEFQSSSLTVTQKEAKAILLKLYSMFSDENTQKFFPEKNKDEKDTV